MKKKNWLWLLISTIFGSSVIVVITVIISSLLVLIIRRSPEEGEEEKFFYNHYRHDPETGDSFSGFTTLPSKLEQDQFVYYVDEHGTENLISDFGKEKYRCSAQCTCGTTDELRRTNMMASSRTLKYLVAAVSSAMAFDVANEYFGQMCRHPPKKKNRIIEEDACIDDYILHEVECDAVENEFTGGATTTCFGRCLHRSWTNDPGNRFRKVGEEYSPEDSVALYSIARDIDNQQFTCERFDLEMFYERPIYMAEEMFIEKDLYNFCKTVSIIRLIPSMELKNFLEKYEIRFEVSEDNLFLVDVCTSGRLDPDKPTRVLWHNHHVECTEDRPKENRLVAGSWRDPDDEDDDDDDDEEPRIIITP